MSIKDLQIQGCISDLLLKLDDFLRKPLRVFRFVEGFPLLVVIIISPGWPRPRRPELLLLLGILNGHLELRVGFRLNIVEGEYELRQRLRIQRADVLFVVVFLIVNVKW